MPRTNIRLTLILGCIGRTSSDLLCLRADVLLQHRHPLDKSDRRDRPCGRSRVRSATVRLIPTLLAPTFQRPRRMTAGDVLRHKSSLRARRSPSPSSCKFATLARRSLRDVARARHRVAGSAPPSGALAATMLAAGKACCTPTAMCCGPKPGRLSDWFPWWSFISRRLACRTSRPCRGVSAATSATMPASDFASLFRTELRRPRHTSGKKAPYGRRNFRIVDRSIDCNRSSCSAILGPIDPPPDVVRHVSGASPAYRDRYRGRRGGHY